ncbi:hypothetical protein CCP3SC1_50017 [Gammaproteobacteria bacterium]
MHRKVETNTFVVSKGKWTHILDAIYGHTKNFTPLLYINLTREGRMTALS